MPASSPPELQEGHMLSTYTMNDPEGIGVAPDPVPFDVTLMHAPHIAELSNKDDTTATEQ